MSEKIDENEITIKEVEEAQKIWGDNIINIGVNQNDQKLLSLSINKMLSLYAYDMGSVLFKPTLAISPNQFSAESYFIGDKSDKNYIKSDKGFALAPYKLVEFKNADIKMYVDIAIAMGVYTFTDYNNKIINVEYSFVYKKFKNDLKIILHHSSLPHKCE